MAVPCGPVSGKRKRGNAVDLQAKEHSLPAQLFSNETAPPMNRAMLVPQLLCVCALMFALHGNSSARDAINRMRGSIEQRLIVAQTNGHSTEEAADLERQLGAFHQHLETANRARRMLLICMALNGLGIAYALRPGKPVNNRIGQPGGDNPLSMP